MKDSITAGIIDDLTALNTARSRVESWLQKCIEYGQARPAWASQAAYALGVAAPQMHTMNEYRVNIAVEGLYGRRVSAASRVEAERKFRAELERMLAMGKITAANGSYDNVYRVKLADGAQVTFHSGPEDPIQGVNPDAPDSLEDFQTVLVRQLKAGIVDGAVSVSNADALLGELGMAYLPEVKKATIMVSVTSTVEVPAAYFEDDGPDSAAERASEKVRSAKRLDWPVHVETVSPLGVAAPHADVEMEDDEGEDDEDF